MNKYLRFRSPSLAPASTEQYVLVNVSKMTIMTYASGGVGDFDIEFHYGESKDFKLILTFTPDWSTFGSEFVNLIGSKIEQLCETGNNNVYMDVGDENGLISVRVPGSGVMMTATLTEVQRL